MQLGPIGTVAAPGWTEGGFSLLWHVEETEGGEEADKRKSYGWHFLTGGTLLFSPSLVVASLRCSESWSSMLCREGGW